MINLSYLIHAILVGFGATLIMDIWAWWLKHSFKIASANYCLVGRWFCYMPSGIFNHQNINQSPKKSFECLVGWLSHYLIGISYALLLIVITSPDWLNNPRLVPALLLGVVSVLMPYLIMQPAFGFGIAAQKTANPRQARLRSLMSHSVFGIGLYVSGQLINTLQLGALS